MNADGCTADGTRVLVTQDEERHPYDPLSWHVEIDEAEVELDRIDRYRDGGTTVLYLASGQRITFPRRFNHPDRTPKLDGRDITPCPSPPDPFPKREARRYGF